MDQNSNIDEKVFSTINTTLQFIITDLQQTLNNTQENIVKEKLTDIIKRMNFLIEETKKIKNY